MGWRTVAPKGRLGKWGLIALALAADYPVRALDGAQFAESIRTEATTRIGTASRRRLVSRDTRFGVALRGDTLVVSIDSAALSELDDGSSRTLDTDAFVGGRFQLLLNGAGNARVLERPFIPDDVIEVSEVGRAMDDFFPPLPPPLGLGATGTDSAGRQWRRLADSSSLRRYRWNSTTSRNGAATVADSVPARVSETTRETSALVWHQARGPLAWTRRIESELTTRLRGQTIMASVVQRIEVRRAR